MLWEYVSCKHSIYYNKYLKTYCNYSTVLLFLPLFPLSVHPRRALTPFLCYLQTRDILCHSSLGMGTKEIWKGNDNDSNRKWPKKGPRIQIRVHSSNTLHNFYCQVGFGLVWALRPLEHNKSCNEKKERKKQNVEQRRRKMKCRRRRHPKRLQQSVELCFILFCFSLFYKAA